MKQLSVKLVCYALTSGLLFTVLAHADVLPERQGQDVSSVPAHPSITTGKTMLDVDRDVAHSRYHDEDKPSYNRPNHQAYHGGNKRYSHTPSCVSCHHFSNRRLNRDPMQAGRERIEALFGTAKEGPRNFSSSATQVQNTSCLSCHNKDTERSHFGQ